AGKDTVSVQSVVFPTCSELGLQVAAATNPGCTLGITSKVSVLVRLGASDVTVIVLLLVDVSDRILMTSTVKTNVAPTCTDWGIGWLSVKNPGSPDTLYLNAGTGISNVPMTAGVTATRNVLLLHVV